MIGRLFGLLLGLKPPPPASWVTHRDPRTIDRGLEPVLIEPWIAQAVASDLPLPGQAYGAGGRPVASSGKP